MSEPSRGVYSVTTTKRRRWLWCAWWTGAPSRAPFRAPDAWSGGARSAEEAKRAAERAAGTPLDEAEPIWARAWVRMQAGMPPWVEKTPRRAKPEEPPPKEHARAKVRPERWTGGDPFAVLGLDRGATVTEIQRAFRRLALVTHPDRGGEAAAFIRVMRARDEALARAGRRSS